LAEELNYENILKMKEEINGRFILSLIQICRRLEEEAMFPLETCLNECVANISTEENKISIEESKELVKAEITTIKDKLRQEMNALLANYVYHYGDKTYNLLNNYVNTYDWYNIPEPRDISNVFINITLNILLGIIKYS